MAQLKITFDNILNVPVGNPNSVSDWNTFFDLPNYGTSFTGVTVNGNSVTLNGGSDITLKNNLFFQNLNITEFWDDGIVVSGGTSCFHTCIRLSYFYSPYISSLGDEFFMGCGELNSIELPSVITLGENCFAYCDILDSIVLISARRIGNYAFNSCSSLTNIYIPLCTELGDTTGNNYVFEYINGNIIDLNISSYLMTVYSGQPDLDIQILQSNNTVTITNPISRPFAYNTGSTISGTNQYGDIAVGVSNLPYVLNVGGVQWWEGPDESVGYVIARPNTLGDQPNKLNLSGYMTFDRSELNDTSFIDLVNNLATPSGPFLTAQEARSWLFANGYWTSYPLVVNIGAFDFGGSGMVIVYNNQTWGWGENTTGELGNNNNYNVSTPIAVYDTNKTFSKISKARNYTISLDNFGQIWGWGYNADGQLGNNSTINVSTPVSICGTKKTFCDISASFYHSLGIDKYGQVWGWGFNNRGQLGNRSTAARCTPVSICGTKKTFCKISVGDYHSLAIDKYGRGWAWGANQYPSATINGALGNNSSVAQSTPVSVCGSVKTFCKIDAGPNFSLALDNFGNIWSWGNNTGGQLGNNSTSLRSTPVSVCGSKKTFCDITTGRLFSVGLDKNGKLWSWGQNAKGQLGDGTIISKSTPISVYGNKTFCNVVASDSNVIAIDNNNIIWGWGDFEYGSLSNNIGGYTLSPNNICGVNKTFNYISAKRWTGFGIDNYGRVWGWGYNSSGQIGDNSTVSRLTPVQISGMTKTFCRIFSNENHTLSIDKDNNLWSWGGNFYGQLGINSTSYISTPVSVCGNKKTFCDVSLGSDHSVGIDKYGRIWSWGYNSNGQLGDNTVTSRSTPIQISGTTKTFCNIDSNSSFNLAIDKYGQIWSWGDNGNGQLGVNSIVSKRTPISICGINKTFCNISTGTSHSLAIDKYGQAWGWGKNYGGALGNNSDVYRSTPVSVCGVKKTFCKISGGFDYTLALDHNGKVWGWGYNANGVLGIAGGRYDLNFCTPIAIPGNRTFCDIMAGSVGAMALDYNGKIWAWGKVQYGLLANNSLLYITTPISISII